MCCCSGSGTSSNSRFVSRLTSQRLSTNVLAPRFCGGTLNVVEAKVQLKNVVTANLPATNNKLGTMLFDSTTNKLVVWTGAAWEQVTSV
jgi:hypothetical protein